jgi:dihydroorotase
MTGAPGSQEAWLLKDASPLGGEPASILMTGGLITEIGPGASLPAGRGQVIDAGGLIALPGLVDLHTHLREPGREDAETVASGTAAAALGGFTAVHAMANTEPVADTAGVVEQIWRLGRQAGRCDVQPVGAVTVGLAGSRLAELGAMADSAARVRVFSDDGRCVSDAVLMRRALEYVRAFGGVIAQHAQEPPACSASPAGQRSPRRPSSPETACWPRTSGRRCMSATSPPQAPWRSSARRRPRAGR